MKTLTGAIPTVAAALGLLVLAGLPAAATTATNLSDFEGEEEPSVKYYPGTATWTSGDTYDNITQPSSGTFRMELRYNSTWWDGDRTDVTTDDRGRAEVKGLGVHQLPGETFDYTTTWRTSAGYQGSGNFCHFFQIKGIDGDNGAPLITASIKAGVGTANMQYWSGTMGASAVARSFTWSQATWQALKMRVKTANAGSFTGSAQASINGDAMSGVTGIEMYRTGTTEYRPKWGHYRSQTVDTSMLGNDYIEHSAVTAAKYTGGASFAGYYKILGQASGRALVVQGASTSNSASVILYDYNSNGTANDEWQLTDIGSGYYRVTNRLSGKDMVVASASTSAGANIIQYTYTSGAPSNDEWQMVDSGGGYFEIRNRNSGRNVQAMGSVNNSQVQQQSDTNGTDQRFQLISIP